MIDITSKQVSFRTAVAEGFLQCQSATVAMIRNGTLPKGEPFGIAKAAGLLASKKTDDLIPHCHPVSIDSMEIEFEVQDEGVFLRVTGKSIGRTGIEMEVLTACSVAALTLYDLFKPVDKDQEIRSIKLVDKTGGKSQAKKDIQEHYTAAILTCSDSVYEGQGEDRSGKKLREILEDLGIRVVDAKVVPDDEAFIRDAVSSWAKEDIPFVFTTGGTGLGPRDLTVEALRPLFHREIPGIPEAMRMHGLARTPRAILSRSVAGSIHNTLVVTLPGSTAGVKESLDAILPGVFHVREMLLGGKHHGS